MSAKKVLLISLCIGLSTVICGALSTGRAAAATAPDPGNLLSDPILLDAASMNIGQIQTFLTSEGGYLATYQSLFDCSAYLSDGSYFLGTASHDAYVAIGAPCGQTVSAATIIYYASQVYGVNPKVVMATIQKESSLITAGSENAYLIDTAMGYGCPDDGGCTVTSGSNFIYQVDNGTFVLRYHYERLRGNTSYWPSINSTVCTTATRYYSPNLFPGQQVQFFDDNNVNYATINLANAATGSLYCYTPHVFNNFSGCTNNSYASFLPTSGSSGMCYTGSYNFYAAYAAWFGSSIILPEVLDRYNYLAANSASLGPPTDGGFCTDSAHTACWEGFQNGYLVYSKTTGTWESYGAIRARWGQLGYQNGMMGFPTGPIYCTLTGSGCYQQYQNGYIVGSPTTGWWESMGSIRARWAVLHFETGTMGYPTGGINPTVNGGYYQQYQNGYIVGNNSAGYWESMNGPVRDRWGTLGFQSGRLGFPTTAPDCTTQPNSGCVQYFQGGAIFWTSSTGAWQVWGAIGGRYTQINTDSGTLGYPTGAEACTLANSGCFQPFQNGYIVGSPASGWWESMGPVRDRWIVLGSQDGRLGYPTSAPDCTQPSSGCKQTFQGGYIFWTAGTGAWQVWGAIGGRYAQLGGASSSLGYPVAAEVCGAIKNNGCFQLYQNGYIVGTPGTGWWESLGGIRTRWGQLSYENGQLGYPTGGQACTLRNSGCFQVYQGGYIVGSAGTGYWESYGPIRAEWASLGYQDGAPGYATGAISCSAGTCSQTYEHGTIFSNSSTTWYVPS